MFALLYGQEKSSDENVGSITKNFCSMATPIQLQSDNGLSEHERANGSESVIQDIMYGAMVILARAISSSNQCLDMKFLVLIYTC